MAMYRAVAVMVAVAALFVVGSEGFFVPDLWFPTVVRHDEVLGVGIDQIITLSLEPGSVSSEDFFSWDVSASLRDWCW